MTTPFGDAELAVHRGNSRAAEEVITLASVVESFERTAPSSHRNPGIRNHQSGNKHASGSKRRRGRLKNARYVTGLLSLPEVGSQLRLECQAVGVSQADCLVEFFARSCQFRCRHRITVRITKKPPGRVGTLPGGFFS